MWADLGAPGPDSAVTQQQATDAGPGQATYSRNEEVRSVLLNDSDEQATGKIKKSYWSSINLANSITLSCSNEIAPILLKTLSKGVFVSLADFTPVVLNAAARGTRPIRT